MSSTNQNKIHPNANKQFDNLILGDSIINRISHKLFSKHQETLKISLSGRGTRDFHSFVNEKLQLNLHPKNVFIQVGSNDLSNNIKPNKLMEMTENLSFSIKEKFESSNLIFCGIIPRIDNEALTLNRPGGGGIRPQAGSSLCCAETVSSRKLKLSDFYYILIGLNSEYKPVPWDIHCCHGNAIVEWCSVKFWLKSVENCIFLLKSFSVWAILKTLRYGGGPPLVTSLFLKVEG